MKKSKFNFIKMIDGVRVLFNANTCALAVVNDEFMSVLNEIDNGTFLYESHDAQLIEKMIKAGCIYNDDDDELIVMNSRRFMNKYQSSTLALTILPTLDCNFRCTYCFEEHTKGKMNAKTQEGLIAFILRRIKAIKNLHIMWFGGEPMLYKDIIYDLSNRIKQLCEDNSVTYSAGMVSNGSLFEPDDIDKFKEYHIDRVQFTIDGPPEIHNKRRISISGEDSFGRIIEVVNLLLGNNIKVNIRINIDKNNISHIDILLFLLKDLVKDYSKLSISFGKVTAYTEVCKNISDDCFGVGEYEKQRLIWYNKLVDMGFEACRNALYPKRKYNYCGADVANSFVIDMDGKIYKCWNQVGITEENCGNVFDDVKLGSVNYTGWVDWNPLENEKCRACKVLPLCMGGCPNNGGNRFLSNEGRGRNIECDAIRDSVDDIITYYFRMMKKRV